MIGPHRLELAVGDPDDHAVPDVDDHLARIAAEIARALGHTTTHEEEEQ